MTKFLKRYYRSCCGFVLCLFLFLPVSAFAQQDASARLDRLENEIQTLSRAVFRGEMPPAGASVGSVSGGADTAAIELRLSQIELEVRTLTGRIEQIDYENRQSRARLEKELAAMERRLAEMEMRFGGAAPAPTAQQNDYPVQGGFDTRLQNAPQTISVTQPSNGVGQAEEQAVSGGSAVFAGASDVTTGVLGTLSTAPPGDGPDASYESAFTQLRDRRYDEAERAFSDFLKRYPDHKLAENARYWLGETFYVRNNFERAARIFAEAYQAAPQGPKGPDNLLKLALSLNGLGKKEDACLTLAQLKKEYKAGAGAILARAEREAANLGCTL